MIVEANWEVPVVIQEPKQERTLAYRVVSYSITFVLALIAGGGTALIF